MANQERLMITIEKNSVALKTLLGRILTFNFANGYSYYIITKVNKKTVKVQWLDYADGWMDKYLGKGGYLDIEYVTEKLKHIKLH
jgi:rhamnogalacturonyl hydrolase YesR